MDSSVVGAGAKKKSSAETINESGVAVSVTDCGAPTPTPPHDGPALLHLNGEQQDVCLELTHHARYAFQRRRFQQKKNNFFFSLSLARFFFRPFSSSFFCWFLCSFFLVFWSSTRFPNDPLLGSLPISQGRDPALGSLPISRVRDPLVGS